ncbi:MAG: hypothetical protein JWN37_439 [Candidatus Nomurabacteria bacterium]|nr:hypothetical protein [Candidatus Nomurabacteria bacterium]
MNSKNILSAIAIIIILIGVYFYFKHNQDKYLTVNNYEQCISAGYPILDSYPQTCKTPDNRIFTNPNQQVSTPIETAITTATSSTPTTSTSTDKSNLIKVDNITVSQIVTSPLTIKGQARGTWYFEASFPVELMDGNGKQITMKPAQAQGEWMTTDFVPFTVTLTFSKPTTATGTLILHKDNPSGDPSRDDSLRIPVRF